MAALLYTLRSSSLGTGGTGTNSSPPLASDGLGKSRYATVAVDKRSEDREGDFERRAANVLAQQDAINKRIAALQARHEADEAQAEAQAEAQREAAKRKAEAEVKRAAEEANRAAGEETRRRADLEAAHLEAKRREAARLEAERIEAETKEAACRAEERAEFGREKERLAAEQGEAIRQEVERKEAEHKGVERKGHAETQRQEAAEFAEALHVQVARQIHEAQAKIDEEVAQKLKEVTVRREDLRLQIDVSQQQLSGLDTAKVAVQQRIEEIRNELSELETAHEQAKRRVDEAKEQLSVLDATENEIEDEAKSKKEEVEKEVRSTPINDFPADAFTYLSKIATRCMADIDRNNIDTEHQLRFKAWPKPGARAGESNFSKQTPGSRLTGATAYRVRRIRLTNLSTTSRLSDIQSLVWGGRVEQFHYVPGTSTAQVLFMKPEDCMSYFNANANGIEIPGDKRVVFVELSPDTEPIHDFLAGCTNSGVSRCVRAINVDPEWGMGGLTKLATANNRKVERVINAQNQHGASEYMRVLGNITDRS